MPGPERRRRRRSSAARRCTSSPTRATTRPPRRGTTSQFLTSAAVAVEVGGGDRVRAGPRRTPSSSTRSSRRYVDDPRFKVAYDQLAGGRRRARRRSARCSARCCEVRTVTAGGVAAIFERRRRRVDPRRRRRRRPTPSSRLQRPQLIPPSGRDSFLGGDRPGIRDDDRPDRRRSPVPLRRPRNTQVGMDLALLHTLAGQHHGVLSARRTSCVAARSRDRVGTGRSPPACWCRSIPASPGWSGRRRPREATVAAAVLGAGPGAMASHRSAAHLWGVPRPDDDPVDVIAAEAVPRGDARRRRGAPAAGSQGPVARPARWHRDLERPAHAVRPRRSRRRRGARCRRPRRHQRAGVAGGRSGRRSTSTPAEDATACRRSGRRSTSG